MDTVRIGTSRESIPLSWDGMQLLHRLLIEAQETEAAADIDRRVGDRISFAESAKPAVLSVMEDAIAQSTGKDHDSFVELQHELRRDTGHADFLDV